MKTFETFLEEAFMNLREVGGMAITKDNCESLLESWLEQLDVQDVIDYGEIYGRICFTDGKIALKDFILNKHEKE